VTVNVNFPESTVQKATDDYVKELYKAKEKGHPTGAASDVTPTSKKTPPKPQPDAGPGAGDELGKPASGAPTSWLPSLVSTAMAAEFEFNVNTPKATAIQGKLAAKLGEVDGQKQAGNIGEGSDGMLVVKAKQPLLAKKLEPLVQEQNGHRAELYEEIQTANKMAKSRLPDIKKSFARSFQSHSPSGTWVQDAGGAWSQK
jgi:uncharacterized protein YdbL (DUF1318 family)